MKAPWRIIDVNFNRLFEGLKIIEDLVRFHLEDKRLLVTVRRIRGLVREAYEILPVQKILKWRASQTDLGRVASFDRTPRRNIDDLVTANMTRLKEAARSLEEWVKINRQGFGRFKQIRFLIYDLEKDLLLVLTKKFDPRFYVVLDEKYISRIEIERFIKSLEAAGAGLLQLRIKSFTDREYYRLAVRIRRLVNSKKIKFIINDRLDIALATDADGVHLGQSDLPLTKVRAMAHHLIIGQSVDNLSEARRAEKEGADYIAIGSIYPTPTKPDAVLIGLDMLRKVSKSVNIPVIAIGGINLSRVRSVFKYGADGIAVASAIFEGDVERNLRGFGKAIASVALSKS